MTNANSDAGSGKPATGGDQPEGGDLVTNSTGGGQGHSHDIQAANHLPPYITVLFCRKD
jgi:hypothetical protein